MIYETVFYNRTSQSIKLPEDVFGKESIFIEPTSEGVKFEFENSKKALWARYKTIEILPDFAIVEKAQADGNIFKVNMEQGFHFKLNKRKSHKSPFSEEDFVTEFLNTGSGCFREWMGLREGKVAMVRGVPSFVSLEAEEPYAKFSKIEILEPTIKRKTTSSPGVLKVCRKQRVSMIPRSQAELRRLKGERDSIVKRRGNML